MFTRRLKNILEEIQDSLRIDNKFVFKIKSGEIIKFQLSLKTCLSSWLGDLNSTDPDYIIFHNAKFNYFVELIVSVNELIIIDTPVNNDK